MRVSMPSLRMTIAGALSTLYLALSSVSRTKLFSTTVTLSLSDAISLRTCLGDVAALGSAEGLREQDELNGKSDRGEMFLESGFVLRRQQTHQRLFQISDLGFQNLKRSSKAFSRRSVLSDCCSG
jgi:hypothetical protein